MRLIINKEYDKFIKEKLFILRKNGNIRLNTNYKYFLYKELEIYLSNCFDDSFSLKESLYRIYYNIDNHPKCQFCQKDYCQFDIKEYTLFRSYCSNKQCIIKFSNLKNKQTKLKRYGNENYNNRKKCKQTKLERYGDENYNNSQLMMKTKLELYNNQSYVNPNKAKQTKLERYGDENYNNKQQTKQTCLRKYGAYSILCQNSFIRENIKNANTQKYGYYYVNPNKCKQTKLERYGAENYNNVLKIQQTCLNKFGYNTIFKVPEISKKIANSEIRKQHEYETKKKNHSHNKSLEEDQSYELLKLKYQDTIRQYKSEKYPFACDFYIPSLNLYIECNYHWTHGGKLYEGSKEDNKLLQHWKDQNTQYYNNAIYTWTNLDVHKFNIAKDNKLNYIIFYKLSDFKEWIKNL